MFEFEQMDLDDDGALDQSAVHASETFLAASRIQATFRGRQVRRCRPTLAPAAEQYKEIHDQKAEQLQHDANTLVLEITCPPGVGPGQSVEVETEDGPMEVVIPDGVEEGDSFEVSIELGPPADAAEPAAVAAVVAAGATAQRTELVATGRKKRKNRGAGGCCGAKPSV